jgi:hypothetical protein
MELLIGPVPVFVVYIRHNLIEYRDPVLRMISSAIAPFPCTSCLDFNVALSPSY